MNILKTVILILVIAFPVNGQGLVIVMNDTRGSQTSQRRMHMDKTHARLEVPELGQVITYDSESKVIRLINPSLKTYIELTQQAIQQMGSTPAKSPAVPAPTSAPIIYRRAGTNTAGQWPCTIYDGFRGTEKAVEVCAAQGSGFSLTAADFQIVQQAVDLVKNLAPQQLMERLPIYGAVSNQGFAGFPVRRVEFRNGQPVSTSELLEFRREAIPAATFAVPAGFTKQEMKMGQ